MNTKKIALLGFRGIGKSTVAHLLGKVLKVPVISLDAYIENKFGNSIAQIVEKNGWVGFREMEKNCLSELCSTSELLLDTGGGILEGPNGEISEEKFTLLTNNFLCVYLRMSDRKILDRLSKAKPSNTRPALAGSDRLDTILFRRKPFYEKAASLTIDIEGMDPDKVSKTIAFEISKI